MLTAAGGTFYHMTLRGRTAVVTGASSGIGRATALELARRGADLVLAARRIDRLTEVADACARLGVTARAVETDVRSEEACRRLIGEAGRVDVLVNNAGYAVFDTAADADPALLRDMMETNYFGTVHCTRAVLPQMLSRGEGAIVNVASIAGIMGFARMAGYGATKAATICFTEGLRDELAASGVRVALVCPGTTNTEFFEKAEKDKMPGASRLIPAVSPERVARAICDAAEDGGYRRIVPLLASIYMRFKELSPRLAHLMMRRVSAFLERR